MQDKTNEKITLLIRAMDIFVKGVMYREAEKTIASWPWAAREYNENTRDQKLKIHGKAKAGKTMRGKS